MPRQARTRLRAWVGIFLPVFVAALVLLVGRFARAEIQLDGRWRQSPLREDFTVQQWLPNVCGPTPQTASSGGGEIVAIRLEGDELAFVGGGRVFRSNQCYDPMPTLSRETHSRDAGGKTWRTRCTTPPTDPRKATLNTLVVATTDKRIDVIETGRYEIILETGHCVADVRRTRSYDLVAEDKPATAATIAPSDVTKEPPETKPDPKHGACELPGDPARLEVRPSKKLMRTDETFQFRALVLDNKGCATRTPTTWKMQAGTPTGISVDAKGLVTIGKEAPEGVRELLVFAANKEAKVTVEVTSPARYDDLLARSGFNAAGESEAAAVVTLASTSIGAGVGRVEDRAKTRRWVFTGIVGGVLVILGVLALILSRRARRAAALERQATERHEAEVAEVLQRRRIREEQHAVQKRAHEESMAAAARARTGGSVSVADAPSEGAATMCPKCGRDYKAAMAFCPTDGASLLPRARVPARPFPPPAAVAMSSTVPKRGKICPTCGERFDGAADFCGKDGTVLVLLN